MSEKISQLLDGKTSIMDKLMAGAKVTLSNVTAVAIEGAQDIKTSLVDLKDTQAKALAATVVSVIGNFVQNAQSLMDTLLSTTARLQPALARY